MPTTCSGTQASDRFGITLDFVVKLHNGTISEDEAKRFLRREEPFVVPIPVEAQKQSLFSVIATTNLNAVAGKKTSKCFTGSRYSYRDNDLDKWLPTSQPKADACVISTLGFAKGWTFVEAAAKGLGIGAGTSTQLLGKALIENGHTITLAQAEEMVEKTEDSENTGMRTDGHGNFFFVETGNEDDPVSVADVRRDDSRWSAFVGRLGSGSRWDVDDRLLVRNLLDTSKL